MGAALVHLKGLLKQLALPADRTAQQESAQQKFKEFSHNGSVYLSSIYGNQQEETGNAWCLYNSSYSLIHIL
ncbi:hypothetical protein KSF_026060 [Reticulibacter mediterranei]|uniref:Uncharacterized protein n=1 Tax=Reticulibacter mediterranei TaxID=2778369 RepID=A0A8J3N1G0_9CHLR|nr:hypothetical protein KSF_026060 [Reticulibacter mediterranei]